MVSSYKPRLDDDRKRNVTITLDRNLEFNLKLLKKNEEIRQLSPIINRLLWDEFKDKFEGEAKENK